MECEADKISSQLVDLLIKNSNKKAYSYDPTTRPKYVQPQGRQNCKAGKTKEGHCVVTVPCLALSTSCSLVPPRSP
ncbi:hypothetical protein ISN45_Aa06g004210 [Arabidopsis thaliana x Arabidopsis arenosa]|uniref:Uncharacterized protein n=2 Tax=Arabidopsis TaxID=3701 RepID=A0A8T1Z749_ARASU|nr:hypothetical protein ISN45_Aa06g004210 [Arabidopsis thaliana x Arabidopsis arenosa]KAG7554153.1 hypothetical protein ISN44_As11g004270 [Arabidopsis suecica]